MSNTEFSPDLVPGDSVLWVWGSEYCRWLRAQVSAAVRFVHLSHPRFRANPVAFHMWTTETAGTERDTRGKSAQNQDQTRTCPGSPWLLLKKSSNLLKEASIRRRAKIGQSKSQKIDGKRENG